MISIDDAFAHYAAHIKPVSAVDVPLEDALLRTLAADAASQTDLPPFPQSAMDGYAIRTSDVAQASEDNPVTLKITGQIAAGRLDTIPTLGEGEAMRIFTGAHMPAGADAAVRREWAERIDDNHVRFTRRFKPGNDSRLQGEELPTGEILAVAGERLHAGVLAALSMAGVTTVHARRRVRIVAITTGDEVVKPGVTLAPGQVFDANAILLSSAFATRPDVEFSVRHITDDLDTLAQSLADARQRADLVITTGGVSMGDHDFVIAASKRAGFEQHFWKVAQKPGKPLYFATAQDTALLGVPGNPGAVFVAIHTHIARVIDHFSGATIPRPVMRSARLRADARRAGPRAGWVRCRQVSSNDGTLLLAPLGRQASHMLSNLALCDSLALLEPGSGSALEGDVVSYIPLL